MGQYADVAGIRTWYDEDGEGAPLVLLHGGMCTNETWGAQMPVFAARFRVLAPERRGHGHTPDVAGPLHYEDMADDTIRFLEQVVGGPAHLVGWSDGGIIGLLVAIRRRDLVRKLVVVGTNYDTSGLAPGVAEMFAQMDPAGDDMAMFRDLHALHSPDGPAHWPQFFAKSVAMLTTEPHIPPADLAGITAPALVLVGDDDLVSLAHTVALYEALPAAELAVIPGASHAVLLERPDLCNQLILDFLEHDPAPTLLPLRRDHERALPDA